MIELRAPLSESQRGNPVQHQPPASSRAAKISPRVVGASDLHDRERGSVSSVPDWPQHRGR
jgi:hypothetical protein